MIVGHIGGGSEPGYQVQRSLRLRSSASAYLSRTLVTPTSQNIYSLRTLRKRGTLGVAQNWFGASTNHSIGFNSSDQIVLTINGTSYTSTPVYRDPSSWYDILYTQNGTAYTVSVNGTSVLSGTSVANTTFNTAVAHQLGAANTTAYSDGYFAAIYFVDGQALTPASFGQVDSNTGEWTAKAYTGTYGNNGFYLPFTDTTSTTTLCYDSSGNANHWTPNNISLTAGATYDSMTDVPLAYGTTDRGNHATWNPTSKSTNVTLSNGNLKVAAVTSNYGVESTQYMTSGKWYAEFTGFSTSNECSIGLCGQDSTWRNSGWGTARIGNLSDTRSWGYYSFNGNKDYNGTTTAYGSSYGASSSDVVMVAYDADNGKIWFGKNGTWAASGDPAAGTNTAFTSATAPLAFACNVNGSTSAVMEANFGQRPFSYTPPTGFKALHTGNLSEPSIVKPDLHFDAGTRTGTGAVANVTGFSFQPDLVWGKSRANAYDHWLYDKLRTTSRLISNSTAAEVDQGSGGVTSFNSDGFSLGANTTENGSGSTAAHWMWKAGGAGVSNTSGTITSTVSVNTTAGFSIVTYTGTGANATVGHGLGVAPKMVIVKCRSAAIGSPAWTVWHTTIAGTQYLDMQATIAASTAASIWNSTVPTSSVFSLGTSTSGNQNTSTYVAYCFAEIAGYSKIGSYTGNGSTDGPMVYCGFRPRWIMVKRTDVATNWELFDTARDPYNVAVNYLYPNLSNAESPGTGPFDFTSNGFKLRFTHANHNASGGTYIFIAIAEMPGKYSLAR